MVDPLSIGGFLLKVGGPIWSAVRKPFIRRTQRKAVERYKAFVRGFPVPWKPVRVPDDTWSEEMRHQLKVALELKHLERRGGPNFTIENGARKEVFGYVQAGDLEFHFSTWLAAETRRREIEKESALPSSPAFPAPSSPRVEFVMQQFEVFASQVRAFPRDHFKIPDSTWTPEDGEIAWVGAMLGYLAEEEFQVQADMSNPTPQDSVIGNRSMRKGYRRTDKAITFEEWAALLRRLRLTATPAPPTG